MPYLLNALYLLLLIAASPWLLYQAWRKGKYRNGWSEKFLGRVPVRKSDSPAIWFHAVSVGEVNLLAPLLAELQHRLPGWEFVISSTSRAGYELAQKKYPDYSVFYCPLDFSWAVRTALHRIRPRMLVLAELELWPNLIRAACEQNVQVAIINGRLSENSFRGYRRLRPLVARILQQVSCIAVQDAEYAERFQKLGAVPNSVHVTGSLKFDGAETDRNNLATDRLRRWAGITDQDMILLAGSTQDPEENLALQTYLTLRPEHPHLRLIVVPRHPERFAEVADLLQQAPVRFARRSTLVAEAMPSPTTPAWEVLLVDTVGELGAWWGTAATAFVGGSFGTRGGQNMLEPAAYGAAVCFGPNTKNFREIVSALLHAEGACVVQDGTELTQFVSRCLTDHDFASALGQQAQQLVLTNLGAAVRTADLLESLLSIPVKTSTRQAA